MIPILKPRSLWHPAAPTNNNGTTRPKLARPVTGGIAVHYTGSPVRAKGSTDPCEVYMPWLQALAVANPDPAKRKSFEYNYVIPPRVDGSAQVWEYAGDYMAAHAGSINNPYWVAVQFAIGVNNHPSYSNYDPLKPTFWQPLEQPQIDAFRWLRDTVLIPSGLVAANPAISEHRNLPTAATTCPGEWVRAHWHDLLQPWLPPDPPEEPMPLRVFKVQATPIPSPPPLFASGDGVTAVWLSAAQHVALGAPAWEDPPITRVDARRYTLVGDCPDGYRGIWGQDTLP